MPISGLVLTLADPSDAARLARDLLGQEPRLEFGELHGNHLPLALETETAAESRDVHDWLLGRPGVLGVDVVFVSVEDPPPTSAGP